MTSILDYEVIKYFAFYFLGAPQVLRQSATPEVIVERGQTAHLSSIVCADPRPRFVAWEWGSLRLEAGAEMGKYYNEYLWKCIRK